MHALHRIHPLGAPPPRDTDPPNRSAAVTEPIHTTREIEQLLPHRWPFLLVDRIDEYDPEARRIVGRSRP